MSLTEVMIAGGSTGPGVVGGLTGGVGSVEMTSQSDALPVAQSNRLRPVPESVVLPVKRVV